MGFLINDDKKNNIIKSTEEINIDNTASHIYLDEFNNEKKIHLHSSGENEIILNDDWEEGKVRARGVENSEGGAENSEGGAEIAEEGTEIAEEGTEIAEGVAKNLEGVEEISKGGVENRIPLNSDNINEYNNTWIANSSADHVTSCSVEVEKGADIVTTSSEVAEYSHAGTNANIREESQSDISINRMERDDVAGSFCVTMEGKEISSLRYSPHYDPRHSSTFVHIQPLVNGNGYNNNSLANKGNVQLNEKGITSEHDISINCNAGLTHEGALKNDHSWPIINDHIGDKNCTDRNSHTDNSSNGGNRINGGNKEAHQSAENENTIGYYDESRMFSKTIAHQQSKLLDLSVLNKQKDHTVLHSYPEEKKMRKSSTADKVQESLLTADIMCTSCESEGKITMSPTNFNPFPSNGGKGKKVFQNVAKSYGTNVERGIIARGGGEGKEEEDEMVNEIPKKKHDCNLDNEHEESYSSSDEGDESNRVIKKKIKKKIDENDHLFCAINEFMRKGLKNECIPLFERLQQNLFFLVMLANIPNENFDECESSSSDY
ncbi:hypothetical protein PGO_122660 [Plasmodium gonderi]|uniref:SS18 N-terminal domain-containing protein n=1 Tax=Plasmodium gonderi TaxID=77519 RepID=A0A1Y1JID1_PLAGO|nr:hypothetical protein PGO_122660 [Plasmodium gonderi]GAW82269.1 hypothetical protein PGO_122660 [Plasmodium gonderi]